MLTLQAKPGVNWDVCPEIEAAQDTIEKTYLDAKAKAVVTSARDGKHSRQTAHDTGKAIDLRIMTLFPDIRIHETKGWYERVLAFTHDLALALEQVPVPGRFDLVLEVDHIHLEYSLTETPNIVGWNKDRFVYVQKKVREYLA